MRFLCDEMLGALSRWLRLLGEDAAYAKDRADEALLAQAAAEDRVLLTRDAALARRAGGRGFLVRSLDPGEQLAEVVAGLALGVREDRFLSRCTTCNGVLHKVDAPAVQDAVPEAVLRRVAEFWRCQACGKVYWRGTHAARIEKRLRALADSRGADGCG